MGRILAAAIVILAGGTLSNPFIGFTIIWGALSHQNYLLRRQLGLLPNDPACGRTPISFNVRCAGQLVVRYRDAWILPAGLFAATSSVLEAELVERQPNRDRSFLLESRCIFGLAEVCA